MSLSFITDDRLPDLPKDGKVGFGSDAIHPTFTGLPRLYQAIVRPEVRPTLLSFLGKSFREQPFVIWSEVVISEYRIMPRAWESKIIRVKFGLASLA